MNKRNERLQLNVTDAKGLRALLESPNPNIDHITTMLMNSQSPGIVNDLVYGTTNLFYAINEFQKSRTNLRKSAWKEIIDLFISHPGCDPTKLCSLTSSLQMTPLMCAVQSGDLDLLKALLPLKAINQPKHLTESFLLSCRRGYTKMAEYLLAKGANTETLTIALAIQSGSVTVCQSLSAAQKAQVGKRNSEGVTPLLAAAKVSHPITLYLMSIVGCDLNPIGPNGTNVFIESIIGGIVDNVKLFIGKGYDVNAKCQGGNTPLHFAVRAGHKHIIAILLDAGADINARNDLGQTALFEIKSTDEETLRVLLSYRECNANLTDNQGELPLTKFIPNRSDDVGVLSCAKILLDQTSVAALSLQHASTEHIMVKALRHGEGGRMLIKLLLDRGCTPSIKYRPHVRSFTIRNLRTRSEKLTMKKETVFEYLVDLARPEDADLIALFIEKGVCDLEPVATCIYELRQAIFNQKGDVESLLATYKCLLLETQSCENADLPLIDRLMFEILRECTAIKSDSAHILTLFLSAGANPNAIDKSKCTPLLALLKQKVPAPLPVAKVLLEWKTTTITNKVQNYDCLRHIVTAKHLDIGMYLVSDVGLDLDTKASNNLVELMSREISDLTHRGYEVNQFAITGLVQLANAIITRSVNINLRFIVDKDCESPLINRLLLQHGASVNRGPIDVDSEDDWDLPRDQYSSSRGNVDNFPLVTLCQGFSRASSRFFSRQRLRSIQAALDAGMDVNGGDTDNIYTPLMSACTNLWLDLVWLLMENGADTNRQYCGKTAFDMLNLDFASSRMKMRRRIAKLLDPLYVPNGPVSMRDPMILYDMWMEMGDRADNDARCIDDESDKSDSPQQRGWNYHSDKYSDDSNVDHYLHNYDDDRDDYEW